MITIQIQRNENELNIRLSLRLFNRLLQFISAISLSDTTDLEKKREQLLIESRAYDGHLFI